MDKDLQQLKDIHLPKAIPWWPIAPGWIILLIVFISIALFITYICYKKYERKKTIKFALAKLSQLNRLVNDNPENINIPAEISILIRRTALHYFPRNEIAGLSGNEWLYFLNQSGKTTKFSGETARLLIEAPYRQCHENDLSSLFALTEDWLKTISKIKSFRCITD